ncbi:alpha/beta fold hydrolase [Sphingosinicella humi]|uniref:Alpha/beta hydrolase n=1 Tax=Allosphingosinicella humi TaxID=2068657 RepID=A0A2U2J1K9_9SPHN|nr:alpha/beta fold hydrolase [Sphingosinicella humi]PWG02206.1 alpha/beta hydrolase [Sphingosinicella humi]
MANTSEDCAPPARLLIREGLMVASRVWRGFGRLGERGPIDGPRLMVIPGFLASDRTTLGLQRALAEAGYRVSGWGMGLNTGVRADTLKRILARVEWFGAGRPVIMVGWSLGGLYAREVAKLRPDLVEKVVTMGTPFSGNRRANNAWRLYEMIAGHPVDAPPLEADVEAKPPVPTLALWSRRDGMVAPACARGVEGQSDRQIELDCSHMGFAVHGRAYPQIIEAIRSF